MIKKLNTLLIKYLIAALLIVVHSSNVSAQNSSEKIFLTDEEQSWIADHPTIIAGNNTDYAPFDFVSAGEPVGLSIDYLNLLASKVGLKVKYVNYGNWSENLKMAMEERIDVLPALVKTEKRLEHFTFSAPYIIDALVLWGRVGSKKIKTITDLKGKRIGIIKDNSISKSYLKHYPDLNYVEFKNNNDALRALSSNKVDVYPNQVKPVEFSITQNNLRGLEIIGEEFVMEERALDHQIAVSKNNPTLMSIINKSIASVTDDEFNEVSGKWILSNQPSKEVGLTLEELEWLSNNKTIRVAAAQNDNPYEYINDEGKISGITGDYLNEISKRLNIEFVWGQNTSWGDALLKYDAHDIEMISYITPTKDRENKFSFTEPYMTVKQAIFTLKGDQLFPTLGSLNGHSIALEKDTAILAYLKRDYPEINVIEADSREELVDLVLTGKVHTFIGDITLFNFLFSKLGVENIIATGFSDYTIENAFGIQPDLPLLYSSIQKAIADISPLEKQAILNKTLSQNITPEIDYGPLFYVIGLALFGGLIILLWNRKLYKDSEHFREIFTNIATAAIVIDERGKIEIFNKTAEKIFGYASAEIVGENVKMLMPDFYAKHHDAYLSNYKKTGIKKIIGSGTDVIALRKDGGEFPVHLGVGQIKISGKTSFIGSIIDLTDITKTQVALQTALNEAKGANAAKSTFLASMSHDLRTPLNAIIGFSETLLEETFGPIKNKKHAEYIDDIHTSGVYLLQLVNDILDLSALEADKRELNYESFDGEKLILECKNIVFKIAADKNIDIAINNSEKLPKIHADKKALKQIIMNLISNAIKFSLPNGNITISSNVTDGHYIFQIIDTGCGISEEDNKRIIKPFMKAQETPFISHEEGTGLGLSIVKSLAEAHGGELNIKSIVGEGTTITVSIPQQHPI